MRAKKQASVPLSRELVNALLGVSDNARIDGIEYSASNDSFLIHLDVEATEAMPVFVVAGQAHQAWNVAEGTPRPWVAHDRGEYLIGLLTLTKAEREKVLNPILVVGPDGSFRALRCDEVFGEKP